MMNDMMVMYTMVMDLLIHLIKRGVVELIHRPRIRLNLMIGLVMLELDIHMWINMEMLMRLIMLWL